MILVDTCSAWHFTEQWKRKLKLYLKTKILNLRVTYSLSKDAKLAMGDM